jgi:hypothetical protein
MQKLILMFVQQDNIYQRVQQLVQTVQKEIIVQVETLIIMDQLIREYINVQQIIEMEPEQLKRVNVKYMLLVVGKFQHQKETRNSVMQTGIEVAIDI